MMKRNENDKPKQQQQQPQPQPQPGRPVVTVVDGVDVISVVPDTTGADTTTSDVVRQDPRIPRSTTPGGPLHVSNLHQFKTEIIRPSTMVYTSSNNRQRSSLITARLPLSSF
mmetsp:Transcript_41111/g.46441  ORF Transcript_41111/g.46441 Transcript_41111/m.46441 type:complete len:112 (+) Transcript_41111:465-800(+)